MFPTIDKKKTGIHLRRIMDEHGLSVKDVQKYLGLASIQSIYHWLNGLTMPTIDNLYALSELFQMPIDEMICGNRHSIKNIRQRQQMELIKIYYEKLNKNVA